METRGDALAEELLLDGATLATLLKMDADGDGRMDDADAEAGRSAILGYLERTLELETDRGRCAPEAVTSYGIENERLRIVRLVSCPPTWNRLRIVNRAFQEDAGGHTFLGSFRIGGQATVGHVFRPATEEISVDWAPLPPGTERPSTNGLGTEGRGTDRSGGALSGPNPSSFAGLFEQGVHHILTGFDHLAFVVSLVLVVTSASELGLVITSFTLAHSLTLALGALGIVSPPAWFIEPTICLTILFVAIENLVLVRRGRSGSARWRPAVTFAFGLVHGFGFSNQLREIGLESQGLAKTLIAFNLGVEAGQLLIVLPLFVALACFIKWFTKPLEVKRHIVLGTSGVVAVLALVWLTERVAEVRILPFG